MKSPVGFSLAELVSRVSRGELKSKALTESYVERILEYNPALNIVVKDFFKEALVQAEALDARFAESGVVGPLHGIPFTIKDAFRIKGHATSFGFPGMNLLPSLSDSILVERLRRAGGVFLGQTNVPLSCFDWQTNSPIYGLTRNPHNLDHTVGGSSGGSAASVAAQFSPFEVGSDVAGSIRYPAHCCGVFGLRPTHGFVPFNDIGPSVHKESFKNLAVAGPLANSIEDLEIVLAVLTDTRSEAKSSGKLKIGYATDWLGISPDPETTIAVETFAAKAEAKGHDVARSLPAVDWERSEYVYGIVLGYEYSQMVPIPFRWRPFIDVFEQAFNNGRLRSGRFKTAYGRGLLSGRGMYKRAIEEAKSLRAEFHRAMRERDLWLTPVSPTAAIPNCETGTPLVLNGRDLPYGDFLSHFLGSTAMFHHPILSAPIALDKNELPIGIQIHGQPGGDWKLLADSKQLKDLFLHPSRDLLAGKM